MDKAFLIIAITRPDFFKGESERINEILKNNEACFVHIRKPMASREQIENLLKTIDSTFYSRLKLHDHFELLKKFPVGGIHLNSRNPINNVDAKAISKSFHTLEEIENTKGLDYFFLSPIFDSISKPGYKAAFDPHVLPPKLKGKRAIALGGVTPSKYSIIKSLGFSGAALLSHFFPGETT